jgi:hypothetical protein
MIKKKSIKILKSKKNKKRKNPPLNLPRNLRRKRDELFLKDKEKNINKKN